jgi:hypothetical protein
MANWKHLAVLRQGVEVWNEWRRTNPLIEPDFRGQSFKGKNLSGADFSKADLRSANFTDATLIGANFADAKCGLQRRWATFLTILSCLLAEISGFLSIVTGTIVAEIFDPSESGFQIAGWISLIILAIFLVLSIRKGIIAGAGVIAVIVVVALAAAVAVVIIAAAKGVEVKQDGIVAAILTAVAITGAVPVAVAGTGVVTGVVSTAVAITGAGTGVLTAVLLGVAVSKVALAVVVAVTVTVAMAVAGVRIGWRAMGGKKDAWIRSFALAFAAIGGTSFQNAKLIDADFKSATLKSTDFREADLTRTYWRCDSKRIENNAGRII